MSATSLYLHIPFCTHRCGYCDFNTYAGLQGLIPEYAEAVRKELEFIARTSSEKISIHTIYFGGGTPSLFPVIELERIIKTIDSNFDLMNGVEISLEANPGTVNAESLNALQQIGVNRLSLGMQSANAGELTTLERQHTFSDVIQAVEWARAAGIDNLNLDLIYGLPGQRIQVWIESLKAVIALRPEHLSLYALTLDKSTPMFRKVEKGMLPRLDDDLAADMYDVAREMLASDHYEQYEISNWARENQAGELFSCKHNIQYWQNLPYIGIGAGAHGFINHYRTVNTLTPASYINQLKTGDSKFVKSEFPITPATIQRNFIDREIEIGETMMMGLRLVRQGVPNQVFQERFGITLEDRFGDKIDHFLSVGLLEWAGAGKDRLRLTSKGYLLGNQVFIEFI